MAMYEAYKKAYQTASWRDFLELTPRLFLIDMLAYHDAAQAKARGSISQAWWTARLMSPDPFPSLESILNPPPPPTMSDVIRELRVEAPKMSWEKWLHQSRP